MASFGKVFKLEKQERYEEFVDSIGLPEDKKGFLLNYKPNQKLEKDGDTYTHTLYVDGAEKSIKFKCGEEVPGTLRTVPIKHVYTVEGNKVTHLMKFGENDAKFTKVVKVFTGDKMEETITNHKWDGEAKNYYSA